MDGQARLNSVWLDWVNISTWLSSMRSWRGHLILMDKRYIGPRQANLVLIAYASNEGSDEPLHPHSLARTSAARSYKQWVKRNLPTESQIPGPSERLGMHSLNVSWRNARRQKFAWRATYYNVKSCSHPKFGLFVLGHFFLFWAQGGV